MVSFRYLRLAADRCKVTVGISVSGMRGTHLAETSTSSSLSSRLRKDFLGVNVTLKAGSTGAHHAVKRKTELDYEVMGLRVENNAMMPIGQDNVELRLTFLAEVNSLIPPTVFLHFKLGGERVLLPMVELCNHRPSPFTDRH